ncbi:hypothetical protein ABZ845_10325 [Streptomyces sp. NPDC047022]|uniref:hypothetical protein n=1 Tax=Streptomyces sp. NPDC047022 TaxID=3155737 RepID=UPI0033D5F4E5
MMSGTVLTFPARVVARLICVVLALTELAWMIRDISDVGLHDTLWTWSGVMLPGAIHSLLATSGLDVLLLAVFAVACATAAKPSGAGVLVTAAALTLVYRTPTVWVMSSERYAGLPDRTWLLNTGIAGFLGAVALLITVRVGRRPAQDPALGGPPAPPRAVPAVFAGVLLAVDALINLAWQVYGMTRYTTEKYGPFNYWNLLTGQEGLTSLLAPSFAWSGWARALLCLLAAVLAFVRMPPARALGIAVGCVTAVFGLVSIDMEAAQHVLFTFHGMPESGVVDQITVILEFIIGLGVLALLIPRGGRAATAAPGGQPPVSPYGTWGAPRQD